MPQGLGMPAQFRRRVFDRDGHRCLNCDDARNLTLDHIDPAGPCYSMRNLQTLCWPCNKAKGKRVVSYLHRIPPFPYAHRV